MLQIAEDLRPVDGRLESSYDDLEGWSTVPLVKSVRQLRLYMGDPESGPMLWLFNGSPMVFPEGQPRPDHLPLPAHYHRTPSFRITLGDQPRQTMFDGVWVLRGEYLLLESNKVYLEPVGVDGHKVFTVFADRRGMHTASKETAALTSDELIALNASRFADFGEGLVSVHTKDSQAPTGAAITTRAKLDHGGRSKGQIDDQSEWAILSDGSRIAAAFMCDSASGPAVIMSRNAPHAIESSAGRWGTDTFRMITKGSCAIGGRTYKAGSFVASEAGTLQDEVIHGPDGSTQLLVVTDRRFWAPLDRAGKAVTSARLDDIAAVLAPFIAEAAHAH